MELACADFVSELLVASLPLKRREDERKRR
jgi:hypothetical protein